LGQNTISHLLQELTGLYTFAAQIKPMYKKQLLVLCALIGLVTACSKNDKGHDDTQQPVTAEVKAIQNYLSQTSGLTIFASSFKEVSFSSADVSGGLTIFAPDNGAITNYDPNARVEALGLTVDEIKYHIVKGIIKKSDLTHGKKLVALNGKELVVTVDGDKIMIDGVLISDVNEDVAKQVVFKISNVLCKKPGAAEITVYDATQWSTTDTEGKTTADADVTLYYTRDDFKNNRAAFTGKTNASGKITFNGLAAGTYYLVAKKDDKYNYVEPGTNNGTPIAYKPTGIFQDVNQINNLPHLNNTEPGDFILLDANQDGKLDANDKVYIPYEIVVTSNKTVQVKSLIGYTLNHYSAPFASKADAQQYLDNLYNSIGSWHQFQTIIDGMMSDDADCSTLISYCSLDNFTITSTNTYTGSLWQLGYNFILGLNRVIANVPLLNLPAAEANPLMAQAKGLRAFVYLQLATYYGGVPLQTKTTEENLMRSPLADTYQFIKNDLAAAIAVLPARYTGADHRRIGADACKLLQARIAMAQGDFATAKQLSGTLIQSSTYSLVNTGYIFVSD
jgi:starch-binding outer membrane protein, SusD/RagB family